MDHVDRAATLEIRQRKQALERHKAKSQPQQHIEKGQVLCIDCDDPVSELRLKALPSAPRCIDCQSAAERQSSLRGN